MCKNLYLNPLSWPTSIGCANRQREMKGGGGANAPPHPTWTTSPRMRAAVRGKGVCLTTTQAPQPGPRVGSASRGARKKQKLPRKATRLEVGHMVTRGEVRDLRDRSRCVASRRANDLHGFATHASKALGPCPIASPIPHSARDVPCPIPSHGPGCSSHRPFLTSGDVKAGRPSHRARRISVFC